MSYQIKGDVHTHTLFSRHAYSTILENVNAAKEAGLEILGSTDHFSEMLFDSPSNRNFQYLFNSVIWPRVWNDVVVLRGCEVDIVGLKGELFGKDISARAGITGEDRGRDRSLFEEVAGPLDYLIASVHSSEFARGASEAEVTQAYLGALEDPKVFILGHTGRSGLHFNIDEVLTAAKEKGKLIEINEHSLESGPMGRHHGVCMHIAERCAELGVGIAVSTDAHVAPLVGRFNHALALLEEIHFPEELIMNRAAQPFLGQLRAAKVCDIQL